MEERPSLNREEIADVHLIPISKAIHPSENVFSFKCTKLIRRNKLSPSATNRRMKGCWCQQQVQFIFIFQDLSG